MNYGAAADHGFLAVSPQTWMLS